MGHMNNAAPAGGGAADLVGDGDQRHPTLPTVDNQPKRGRGRYRRGRRARVAKLERNGDGYRRTIDPPSRIPGLNRRFEDHGEAVADTAILCRAEGFEFLDLTGGPIHPGAVDPVRRLGSPKVIITPRAGAYIVAIMPRPFGCAQMPSVFYDADQACSAAVGWSLRYAGDGPPLPIEGVR